MSSTVDKKVAIIGGGVSGLACAWHLHMNSKAEVHIFEAEDRLGGHAHSMNIQPKNSTNGESVDVDVGFMVFNDSNCFDEGGNKTRTLFLHLAVDQPGHFCCNNGACIESDLVCDGSSDCDEQEDEENCQIPI